MVVFLHRVSITLAALNLGNERTRSICSHCLVVWGTKTSSAGDEAQKVFLATPTHPKPPTHLQPRLRNFHLAKLNNPNKGGNIARWQSEEADGRMSRGGIKARRDGENLAAVGSLIRIIQGEMAPGLGEISATLSRITPGTIRTQSCLMSPTHPSCM